MVKIIESYTAPNPREYTYWVDLASDPNKGVIKYFKGNGKWAAVNDQTNDDQSKDIAQLTTSVNELSANKVDKVSGKGLSTNDYTTADKNKLAGLTNYNDAAIRKLITDLTARVAALETSAA